MNLKKQIEYTPKEVRDYAWKEAQMNTRYVGWLDFDINNELFVRVYAFRKTKSYGFQLREVIRENIEDLVSRDMYFTGCAGWKVVYKPERKRSTNWYGYTYYAFSEDDFGVWKYNKVGVQYTILNLDRLYEGKYKYCGYQHGNLFEYLRAYEKNPEVEFFGKIGLRPSKSLVNKCKKDKGFAHFLWQNKDEYYTPKALIYAYDHHIDCKKAQQIVSEEARARMYVRDFDRYIRGKNVDKVKIYYYCEKNKLNKWAYKDYLKAIDYLGLDFSDTKNLFPKDFKRMHDLRANEYASKKVKEDAKAKKGLAAKFKAKNEELRHLETRRGSYLILLPNTIRDLKTEGNKLHHCVGKMGYDNKVATGQSIIAFVREKSDPSKPFVTVEYSVKSGKVVQCYGNHDSKPEEKVIKFVNAWAEHVRKELRASGI